jgi:C4-dicarboxylate transporter/malic acid transport protein
MSFVGLAPARPASVNRIAAAARGFSPNWFTATMGTGGLSLVLHAAPIALPGREALATGLWVFNIGLFAAMSALYAGQWLFYAQEARRALHHPVMSMFFGAIPMGLATIVNGFIAYAPSVWAIPVAEPLWWFDVALSVVSGLAVPYLMFTRHEHRLERMTAVWLIPIVAAEVAAASGALLAPHLDAERAYLVVLTGYALWAFSVPLAMSVLAILFLRLALHDLPEREFGASGWLALGPIGTGALGLLLLGADAPAVFAAHGGASVGEVARGLGVIGGLILWGYGLWWLGLALLKTQRYLRGGLPFNLGWWAFTFPLAVYTLATFALARATGLAAIGVFGDALALGLAAMWAIVAARTAALLVAKALDA